MASLQHTFRLGLRHPERTYRLGSGAVEWQDPRGRGRITYAEIDQIQLFKVRKFGVGGQTRALVSRCVLRARSGETITLAQDHYVRFGVREDRLRSFRLFTDVLVARVSNANPRVRITHAPSRSPHRNGIAAQAVAWGMFILRRLNPGRATAISSSIMRTFGPWIPEHRIGQKNLSDAFPEKSAAEIERVLRGVWDNYGRVCAEIVHMDSICDGDLQNNTDGKIVVDAETIGRLAQWDRRPLLFFTAHLANWEIPASVGRMLGLDIVVPVRRQHLDSIADFLAQARPGTYIPIDGDTTFKLKSAVDRGASVAIMVDQHIADGIDVQFFGRSCKVTPALARLARALERPILGIRTIRLPDHRLRVEVTGPIDPSRDIKGQIDVVGTMQAIMSIVEGWVREHPDQWLWLHRRWR